jgi:hypothetical protein
MKSSVESGDHEPCRKTLLELYICSSTKRTRHGVLCLSFFEIQKHSLVLGHIILK